MNSIPNRVSRSITLTATLALSCNFVPAMADTVRIGNATAVVIAPPALPAPAAPMQKKEIIETAAPGNVASVLPVISSIQLSPSAVAQKTPATIQVSSPVWCMARIYVNGVQSGIVSSNSNNATISLDFPGTYEISAEPTVKSDFAPGSQVVYCMGKAKTTLTVTGDPNWPCSQYPGYAKSKVGENGFICAPPNPPYIPSNAWHCPSGTVFFSYAGALFGCAPLGFLKAMDSVAHP